MRLLSLMRYRVAAIIILAVILIAAVAVPIAVRAAHASGGALPPTVTSGTRAAPPVKTMGNKATPPKKANPSQTKEDPDKKPCHVDF